MRWTWDPDKAAATASSTACRSKRRCSCSTIRSMHQSRTRTRMVIAGTPSDLLGRCCCWSFTLGRKPKPDDEPVGRIISARKATAHERKAYEEGNL